MRTMIIVLSVLLVGLQHGLWFGDRGLGELRSLERAVHAQREINRSLQERNSRLAAEVVDLKKGLDAVEERARRDLGMTRKDETFFQLAR